jgi:hypothetical protein
MKQPVYAPGQPGWIRELGGTGLQVSAVCLGGGPLGSMPGLFDLDPKMKRAKRPDGSYGWRASGALARLSFVPAPSATGSAGLSSKPKAASAAPAEE